MYVFSTYMIELASDVHAPVRRISIKHSEKNADDYEGREDAAPHSLLQHSHELEDGVGEGGFPHEDGDSYQVVVRNGEVDDTFSLRHYRERSHYDVCSLQRFTTNNMHTVSSKVLA